MQDAVRRTLTDDEPARTDRLWADLLVLVADLAYDAAVVTSLRGRIDHIRRDWEADCHSEWLSEHLCELNIEYHVRRDLNQMQERLLSHCQTLVVVLDELAHAIAQSADPELAALVRLGRLAETGLHPPIDRRSRVIRPELPQLPGRSVDDPAVNDNDVDDNDASPWQSRPRADHNAWWYLPRAYPRRDDWPDEMWARQLAHDWVRCGLPDDAVEHLAITSSEIAEDAHHCATLADLHREAMTHLASPRQSIAEPPRDWRQDITLTSEARRISRTGFNSLDLSPQHFSLVSYLLAPDGQTTIAWFTQHWNRFGRAETCQEQTVVSAMSRCDTEIRAIGLQISRSSAVYELRPTLDPHAGQNVRPD
jgi:hypothetical protein